MIKGKLYTKSGDKGMTSLVGGYRVRKSSLRLDCYGTTDELNSFIGLLMAEAKEQSDKDFLLTVQHRLFSIGSHLATDPKHSEYKIESKVTDESIKRIEQEIDAIQAALPKMNGFILPSGCRSTSVAHLARTVCRRAERCIYRLIDEEETEIDSLALIYINRLSDYLFALARKECLATNGEEINWDYTCI